MRSIWQIAVKEIKIYLRQKQSFVFMVLFPIALMTILGLALSNTFSNEPSLGAIRLLYSDTIQSAELKAGWDGFQKGLAERDVVWTKLEPGTEASEEISKDRYTAYLEVGDSGVRVLTRDGGSIEANLVQGMLTAFVDRYNLAAAAYRQSPEAGAKLAAALAGTQEAKIEETSLAPDKTPGSMDYYALVMSTMIAFYACLPGSEVIRNERRRHTDIRLMSSPLRKGELFAGKVLGSTAVNFFMVLLVLLFSRFAFGAEWGSHPFAVLAVLLTEVLFAVSAGIAASYLFKNQGGQAAMFIFTQIASFLGGAYFPISDMSDAMGMLTWISPLKWANRALIDVIYNGHTGAVLLPIALNLGFAVLLLAASAWFMNRKEGL
ncbi:ABC transporter permease [Gorillibacterium sp. sgz500922]|uniref:ABC transporter permease n=1 Tax=Gorillibacterium sp. sgz500922 TaxID=3446694 RepID=UPI003F671136